MTHRGAKKSKSNAIAGQSIELDWQKKTPVHEALQKP